MLIHNNVLIPAPIVLVTGGAGYIGSHAVRALQHSGYRPIVLDNLVYGHQNIVKEVLGTPMVVGQVGDRDLLVNILCGEHPSTCGQPVHAVLHFAAYAYVGESVGNPSKYYRNNVGDTLTLLEAIKTAGERTDSRPLPVVFSSTCATYGIPDSHHIPITESCPQRPVNPYGWSKMIAERMIIDFGSAYGLPYTVFRYFNAAGADPAGDLGEDHNPETHLIPLVFDALLGLRPCVKIFGDNYATPDGTCIRDYIHVSDLADAHVLGLQKLLSEGGQHIFNLGNGSGYSVKQVIDMAKAVTGKSLQTQVEMRRPGDPPVLVASAEKARCELGWQPRYPALETILKHGWAWHQHHFLTDARSSSS